MNKKLKIILVVGARPNFMKVAPIISEIKRYNRSMPSPEIEYILVHTGQHYDKKMSDLFFEDLRLPRPDIYLEVGSCSHAVMTAEVMKKFETVMTEHRPDVVVVVGDVNSTVACAITASKMSYGVDSPGPVIAHVEAGLRSYDRAMPEEINRVLTDHISDILLVTEQSGIDNLKNEGIPEEKIFFVGNTMIDTLLKHQDKTKESRIISNLGLSETGTDEGYALVTLHRPSNVDNINVFKEIISSLVEISKRMKVVFSAHPRTSKLIAGYGMESCFNNINEIPASLASDKINMIQPLGYIDFLCLMQNARIVLTDSGGIQEETTCLGVPCITLRENTERPVTVTEGTNVVAGVAREKVITAFEAQLKAKAKDHKPMYWDGSASKRILEVIVRRQASAL